jgi:putative colanic acid biosynthesis UDP-glucose lipid carrier transferase
MIAYAKKPILVCLVIAPALMVVLTLVLSCWVFGKELNSYYALLFASSLLLYPNESLGSTKNWSNESENIAPQVSRNIFDWSICVWIIVFFAQLLGFAHQYDIKVLFLWHCVMMIIVITEKKISNAANKIFSTKNFRESAIIVGVSEAGLRVARMSDSGLLRSITVHGFFDDRKQCRSSNKHRYLLLGATGNVVQYIKDHNISYVLLSHPIYSNPRLRRIADELKDTTASVYFLPELTDFEITHPRSGNFGGLPVIAVFESPFIGINAFIKRLSDLLLCSALFILTLPIFVLVALAVASTSKGPVIYKQKRYGLDGQQIIIYKFRSMKIDSDNSGVMQAKKNDSRLTSIGGFLRTSSIDELPQLINVLQGRMSLIGPRPHAVTHNELYRKLIKGYMLRHKVKPGITGWAQIHGLRGETETIDKMEERVRCDLEYVRNWNFWLDIWIVFKTVGIVLGRKNAY